MRDLRQIEAIEQLARGDRVADVLDAEIVGAGEGVDEVDHGAAGVETDRGVTPAALTRFFEGFELSTTRARIDRRAVFRVRRARGGLDLASAAHAWIREALLDQRSD